MKTSLPIPSWRRGTFALCASVFFGLIAFAASVFAEESTMKIRLTVGGQVATATLYDNATARDFASLLPLGKVDEGMTILSQPGPYQLLIERIEP